MGSAGWVVRGGYEGWVVRGGSTRQGAAVRAPIFSEPHHLPPTDRPRTTGHVPAPSRRCAPHAAPRCGLPRGRPRALRRRPSARVRARARARTRVRARANPYPNPSPNPNPNPNLEQGHFGFMERTMTTSERLGSARITVHRLNRSEGPATVYFTTQARARVRVRARVGVGVGVGVRVRVGARG